MFDESARDPRFPEVVTLAQDEDVHYWMQRFGVSEFSLRSAVAAVGHAPATIEVWLRLNR